MIEFVPVSDVRRYAAMFNLGTGLPYVAANNRLFRALRFVPDTGKEYEGVIEIENLSQTDEGHATPARWISILGQEEDA